MDVKIIGKRKSYASYISNLKNVLIRNKYSRINKIGNVMNYPFYVISINSSKGQKKKEVLLSTGTHGDEPAGPLALLKWLRNFDNDLLERFNFTILPCINPSGYELGTRENRKKIDINREFSSKKSAEANIVKKFLRKKRFDISIELHEDWEFKGFYMYELSKGNKFGKRIIKEVSRVCKIAKEKEIDGFPAKKGIISPKKIDRMRLKDIPPRPLALYNYKNNTNHTITFETPSQIEMKKRVNAHNVALKTALNALKEGKQHYPNVNV